LNFWRRSPAIYPWNPEEFGTRDWPSRNWNRRSLWVAAPKSLVHVEWEKLLENYIGAQSTFSPKPVLDPHLHFTAATDELTPEPHNTLLNIYIYIYVYMYICMYIYTLEKEMPYRRCGKDYSRSSVGSYKHMTCSSISIDICVYIYTYIKGYSRVSVGS